MKISVMKSQVRPVLLCLWPALVLEGNADFQIDLGGNQDVIVFHAVSESPWILASPV